MLHWALRVRVESVVNFYLTRDFVAAHHWTLPDRRQQQESAATTRWFLSAIMNCGRLVRAMSLQPAWMLRFPQWRRALRWGLARGAAPGVVSQAARASWLCASARDIWRCQWCAGLSLHSHATTSSVLASRRSGCSSCSCCVHPHGSADIHHRARPRGHGRYAWAAALQISAGSITG